MLWPVLSCAMSACAGRGNRHACRARVAQMQALPDGSTMRDADASLQSRCDGWGVAGAVGVPGNAGVA